MPKSLWWTNVIWPKIFQYFIYILINTNSGTIMTLYMNLGMYSLTFMTPTLQCWYGGHTLQRGIGLAIVWCDIFRLTVFTWAGFIAEIIWIMLAAFYTYKRTNYHQSWTNWGLLSVKLWQSHPERAKWKWTVTYSRAIIAMNCPTLWLDNIYISMPTLVAFEKKQKIAERNIKRMEMTDVV